MRSSLQQEERDMQELKRRYSTFRTQVLGLWLLTNFAFMYSTAQ